MRKITVAVCLDDNLGMMFFGKRQSRDRVLIAEFIKSSESSKIYINEFSKALFSDADNIIVCENPLSECTDGGIAFVENLLIKPYTDDINKFIIYRWNRAYPSDFRFDVDLNECGFLLDSVFEFEGSSHEKITKEVHKK